MLLLKQKVSDGFVELKKEKEEGTRRHKDHGERNLRVSECFCAIPLLVRLAYWASVTTKAWVL